MTMTTEHLVQFAQYYAEAVENPKAFKNWEWEWDGGWHPCVVHLGLYCDGTTFRRKPNTIEITCRGKTYTLPETMRAAPEAGTKCWVVGEHTVDFLFWAPSPTTCGWLASGRIHATQEVAQQWFDAMREIRGGKS